jgi:hypothetical protein
VVGIGGASGIFLYEAGKCKCFDKVCAAVTTCFVAISLPLLLILFYLSITNLGNNIVSVSAAFVVPSEDYFCFFSISQRRTSTMTLRRQQLLVQHQSSIPKSNRGDG